MTDEALGSSGTVFALASKFIDASTLVVKKADIVAGKVKGELANYRELAAFAQFGSDLDEKTKAILDKGDRFVELFKQPPTAPKSAEIQCGIIWAMQNGFFNDMPVKSVQAAAASLQTHLETAKPGVLAKIRLGSKIEKDGEAELKSACETWRRSFKA